VVTASTKGRQEIIGLGVGPREVETLWMGVLRSLRACGLDGVNLVFGEAHTALKGAISLVYDPTWQLSHVQ
jgi:transposase-like protein